MHNLKVFSAVGLYANFLLIGHQGPLAAHAIHDAPPLVIAAPEIEQTVAAVMAGPQVLGASTSEPAVLFYNPEHGVYEESPSHLSEEELNKLQLCISKKQSSDMREYERCYAGVMPKVNAHDHSHTHKKHVVKFVKKDEGPLEHSLYDREAPPRAV
jgi:hypothetical protein